MYNFNELIILNRPQSQGGWVPLKEMKGQEAIAQLEAECLGGICVCGHHIDVHMCTPKRERERKREKEREREGEGGRERKMVYPANMSDISRSISRTFHMILDCFPLTIAKKRRPPSFCSVQHLWRLDSQLSSSVV